MGKLKIVDGDRLDTELGMVADAIRTKAGTGESMAFPDGFCAAIEGMSLADHAREKALDLYITNQLTEYTSDVEGEMLIHAFRNCTSLISVSLPRITEHGNYGFQSCSNLKTVSLPSVQQIAMGGFIACVSLTDVYTPMITNISAQGFMSCNSLARFDAYYAKKIATKAFYGCSELRTLILRSDTVVQLLAGDVLTNTPIVGGTGYVYVPAALVADYQAAQYWSEVASQFRAIEDYPEIVGGGSE